MKLIKNFTAFINENRADNENHSQDGLARLKELGLAPHTWLFDYAYWYGGEDDYDFDHAEVEAFTQDEARDLAYEQAKADHRHVRSSKHKFTLLAIDGIGVDRLPPNLQHLVNPENPSYPFTA